MDLIDRNVLYSEMVKANSFGELTAKKAIKRLANAPIVDAEPVIRCKDCKHRAVLRERSDGGFVLEFPDDECPCNCADPYYSWRPGDGWYCADAERK